MTPSAVERRRGGRSTPFLAGWRPDATVRPGLPIRIVNIDSHGVLVECRSLLRPGQDAELQLLPLAAGPRSTVRGRVDRCSVSALTPLAFAAAIVFECALSTGAGARVASTPASTGVAASGMDYPEREDLEVIGTR